MGMKTDAVVGDGRAREPSHCRPRVVTLCGSTRFRWQFQRSGYDLTMTGAIVLSAFLDPDDAVEPGGGGRVALDPAEKAALAELHKRRIDLSDEVFVLNVGGYLGDSTRSEIAYAKANGVPVFYLE